MTRKDVNILKRQNILPPDFHIGNGNTGSVDPAIRKALWGHGKDKVRQRPRLGENRNFKA